MTMPTVKRRAGVIRRKNIAVGQIGLGIMGSAFASNLMKARFTVVGYDIASGKRRHHARAGGRSAQSVSDAGGRISGRVDDDLYGVRCDRLDGVIAHARGTRPQRVLE